MTLTSMPSISNARRPCMNQFCFKCLLLLKILLSLFWGMFLCLFIHKVTCTLVPANMI